MADWIAGWFATGCVDDVDKLFVPIQLVNIRLAIAHEIPLIADSNRIIAKANCKIVQELISEVLKLGGADNSAVVVVHLENYLYL